MIQLSAMSVVNVAPLFHLIVTLSLQPSSAKWEFELLLHSYKNPTSTAFVNKADVHCCDINVLSPCSDDPCDNIFNFTLSPVTCQLQNNQQPCSYGNYQSKTFSDHDTIIFNDSSVNSGGLTNPLKFSGEVWPANDYVMLVISIDDYDSTSYNDLVDLMVLPLPISQKTNFTPVQEFTGFYNYSFISFSYKMECSGNYFGPTCDDTKLNTNIVTRTPVNSPSTSSCILSGTDPASSNSHPAFSSKTSTPILYVSVGLGMVILTLIICLSASCFIIIQLFKKTRRKTIDRRPLPPVPVNISASSSIRLEQCPAYEELDDDEISGTWQ